MSRKELVALMGKPDKEGFHRNIYWICEEYTYRDGPATVTILLTTPELIGPEPADLSLQAPELVVFSKDWTIRSGGVSPWRLRRWAEQAYTAIHGPKNEQDNIPAAAKTARRQY